MCFLFPGVLIILLLHHLPLTLVMVMDHNHTEVDIILLLPLLLIIILDTQEVDTHLLLHLVMEALVGVVVVVDIIPHVEEVTMEDTNCINISINVPFDTLYCTMVM